MAASLGSKLRSGSGVGTCSTRIWPSSSGCSGMRWRDWMSVASSVASVTSTSVVSKTSFLILTAFTLSSEPWSITLRVSSGPMMANVICRPPVPQPRPMGISREAKGTW